MSNACTGHSQISLNNKIWDKVLQTSKAAAKGAAALNGGFDYGKTPFGTPSVKYSIQREASALEYLNILASGELEGINYAGACLNYLVSEKNYKLEQVLNFGTNVTSNTSALGNTERQWLLKNSDGIVVGVIYNASLHKGNIDTFMFRAVNTTPNFAADVEEAESEVTQRIQKNQKYFDKNAVSAITKLGHAVRYTEVLPEGESYDAYLRGASNRILGFTKQDPKTGLFTIYLTKDGLRSNTVVHEYTHVFTWAMLTNPDNTVNQELVNYYYNSIINSAYGQHCIEKYNIDPDLDALTLISEVFAHAAEELYSSQAEIQKEDASFWAAFKHWLQNIKALLSGDVINKNISNPGFINESDVRNMIQNIAYASLDSFNNIDTNDDLGDVHSRVKELLGITTEQRAEHELLQSIATSIPKAEELNNGHDLSLTPNGNQSYLYQELENVYSKRLHLPKTSPQVQTLAKAAKAQYYSDAFLNANGNWIKKDVSFFKYNGYTLAFNEQNDFEPRLFYHGTPDVFESFDTTSVYSAKGKINVDTNNTDQVSLVVNSDGSLKITINDDIVINYQGSVNPNAKYITINPENVFAKDSNGEWHSFYSNTSFIQPIKFTLYKTENKINRIVGKLPSPIRAIQFSSDFDGACKWVQTNAANNLIQIANKYIFNAQLQNEEKEQLYSIFISAVNSYLLDNNFDPLTESEIYQARDLWESFLKKAKNANETYKASSYWGTHTVVSANNLQRFANNPKLKFIGAATKAEIIAKMVTNPNFSAPKKSVEDDTRNYQRYNDQLESVYKSFAERVLHPEAFVIFGTIKEDGLQKIYDAENGEVVYNGEQYWNQILHKQLLEGKLINFDVIGSKSPGFILANVVQETNGKSEKTLKENIPTHLVNAKQLFGLLQDPSLFKATSSFGTYDYNTHNFLDNVGLLDENTLFTPDSILTKSRNVWDKEYLRNTKNKLFVFTENLAQFGGNAVVTQTSAIARSIVSHDQAVGLITNLDKISASNKVSTRRLEDSDLTTEIPLRKTKQIVAKFLKYAEEDLKNLNAEEAKEIQSWFMSETDPNTYKPITYADVIKNNFKLIALKFRKLRASVNGAKIELPIKGIFNSIRTEINIERCPELYKLYVSEFQKLKDEFDTKEPVRYFYSTGRNSSEEATLEFPKKLKFSTAAENTSNTKNPYINRTIDNVKKSDVTIAFAWGIDGFNSSGEKLTKSIAVQKYIPADMSLNGTNFLDYENIKNVGDSIYNLITSRGLKTNVINIAGNSLKTLASASKLNITQKQVDLFIANVLAYLYQKGIVPNLIISGGQSGADEAGAKAGIVLGIPTEVHAPADYSFIQEGGTKTVKNESAFKERFKHIPPIVDLSSVQIPETVYHYADDLNSFIPTTITAEEPIKELNDTSHTPVWEIDLSSPEAYYHGMGRHLGFSTSETAKLGRFTYFNSTEFLPENISELDKQRPRANKSVRHSPEYITLSQLIDIQKYEVLSEQIAKLPISEELKAEALNFQKELVTEDPTHNLFTIKGVNLTPEKAAVWAAKVRSLMIKHYDIVQKIANEIYGTSIESSPMRFSNHGFDENGQLTPDILTYEEALKSPEELTKYPTAKMKEQESSMKLGQIQNNYFAQVKGGTANAIFFTDNPNPKAGTTLDRAYQLKVRLNVDPSKVKYVFGTKEQMHQNDSSFTAEVNQAEAEGYEAVRFIGLDDNQEVNQNITVIFDPSKASIKSHKESKKVKPKYSLEQLQKEGRSDLDVAALLTYYLNKENKYSEDEIADIVVKYLNGDSYVLKLATRILDLIGIRRAQLHQFNLDFNKVIRNEYGVIDWEKVLGNIDLRKEIESNEDVQGISSNLSVVKDIKVDPAEIIMPKLYKSNFHLGNLSVNEIDENYFKRVNAHYNSALCPITDGQLEIKIPIDFYVRTHTSGYDVILSPDLISKVTELQKLGYRTISNISRKNNWRIDSKGNKLYKLPEDSTSYIIMRDTKGNEVIIFKEANQKEALDLIDSTYNLVSCQGFLMNTIPTEELLEFIVHHNLITTNNLTLHKLKNTLETVGPEEIRRELQNIYITQEEKYKSDLASTLYNSFLRTLQVISVRIPTQAFQSIMAAKVVHLTNDEYNNVFVNRWQFWLQGSDLDIDKSYIMGADISSTGHYNHWSPLADFTTRQLADISDTLPVPDQTKLVTPENYHKVSSNITPKVINDLGQFIDNQELPKLDQLTRDYILLYNSNGQDSVANSLYKKYNIKNDTKPKQAGLLKIKSQILQEIKNKDSVSLHYTEYMTSKQTSRAFKELLGSLNKHTTHVVTDAESRNIIQRNIIKVSLDERNMKAGYSPIDVAMDKFKDALKAMDNGRAYTLDWNNGFTIPYLQYNNSVGKADVGIMANGLKAFFALTQYFNQYRKQLAEHPQEYTQSPRYFISKLPIIQRNTYKYRFCNQLSDIQFEAEAVKALTQALHTFVDTNAVPYESHDDASLLISSLISLATDNAKEMALGKMNASKDLARMHLYLVMMGYSAEEVVKITTSPAFTKLKAALDASFFSSTYTPVDTVIRSLMVETESDEERLDLQDLLYIYLASGEMSTIARLGGVNQGVKVDVIAANQFCQNFENIIVNQYKNVLSDEFINSENIKGAVDYNNDPFYEEYYRRHHQYPKWIPAKQLSGFYFATSVTQIISTLTNLYPSEITYELWEKYINKLQEVMEGSVKFNQPLLSPINMVRYFDDPQYRNFVVNAYELCKMSFNPYDCINHLPHFYEMLHAFVISNETIKMSSKARIVLQESKKLNPYEINNITEKTVEAVNPDTGDVYEKTEKVTAFEIKSINADTAAKKGYAFYNDKIMAEWLEEHGAQYKFQVITKINDDGSKDIIEFDLTTNSGIIKFCNFMAYTVIPRLMARANSGQKLGNSFLRYLRSNFKKASNDSGSVFLPGYKFSFDTNFMNSVSDQNKIFYLTQGFVELTLTQNGKQKTLGEVLPELGFLNGVGANLPLGELFYLYDKFTSMNAGYSSLSKAFELYLQKIDEQKNSSNIAKELATIKLEHDLGIRPDFSFNPADFTIFAMQNIIRHKLKGKVQYGKLHEDPDHPFKVTGWAVSKNISDVVVFNLQDKSEGQKEFKSIAERFIKLIQSGQLLVDPRNGGLEFKTINSIDFPAQKLTFFTDRSFEGDLNLVNLLNYLKSGSKDDLKRLSQFINSVYSSISKNSTTAWKPNESGYAMQLFADHLKQLGLNVILESDGASYVDANGDIHLNKFSGITTPMHELMHIIFAVMKSKNYAQFHHLMHQVNKLMPVIDTRLQLETNDKLSQQYGSMMENDRIEEAFCRVLELIAKNQLNPESLIIEGQTTSLWEFIKNQINPYVSYTFGIPTPADFTDFLKDSVIKRINNSSVFIRPTVGSTKYIDNKVKVGNMVAVSEFIRKQVDNGTLEETEC